MHKIISLSHIPQQDVKEVVEQHFNKSSIFSYFFCKKKKKNPQNYQKQLIGAIELNKISNEGTEVYITLFTPQECILYIQFRSNAQ